MPRNSAAPSRTTDHGSTTEKSLFEQQRDELVGEIAVVGHHRLPSGIVVRTWDSVVPGMTTPLPSNKSASFLQTTAFPRV